MKYTEGVGNTVDKKLSKGDFGKDIVQDTEMMSDNKNLGKENVG